ncbi:hypothetical protein GCM10009785_34830 [Brooklawnia cerclae]|uniref:HK97 gp10 family phage protein n=1 Tax=Brooklawnia cerclae TaxID=349934 RepID=A0ABX0SJ81_9ACTN|nr:HK97 gp10 family phage protein [Brooklawnia cerclae]NIH58472.1 hypothetical protein [Brooklawnia cerclae]
MADSDFSEIRKLAADLRATSRRTQIAATQVVRKVGYDAEAVMKEEVPVDTGALKNSVSLDFSSTSDGMTAEIGPTVEYAGYVAYGTGHHPEPNPYDVRTIDRVEPGFVEAMARLGGDIL